MMRILIVEDEERLARRLARVLDGEGYAAETVGDCRSALAEHLQLAADASDGEASGCGGHGARVCGCRTKKVVEPA